MAPSRIDDGAQTAMNQTVSDFSNEYLKGIEPCYFPVLDDGVPSNHNRCSSVEVPFDIKSWHAARKNQKLSRATSVKSAWALVLRSFVGKEDVCFWDGTEDFEAVLCLRLGNSEKIHDLVRSVQKDRQLKLLHRNQASRLWRKDLSNTAVSNNPGDMSDGSGVSSSFLPDRIFDTESFHLQHSIIAFMPPSDPELSLSLRYNTSKLSNSNAKNVAYTFARALELVVTEPDRPLAATDIFSDRDSEQIWDWNYQMPETVKSCLHHWFEEQASRSRIYGHFFAFFRSKIRRFLGESMLKQSALGMAT